MNDIQYFEGSSQSHIVYTMLIKYTSFNNNDDGNWQLNYLHLFRQLPISLLLPLNIYLSFELCECDAMYIYERTIMKFKIYGNRPKRQMNEKKKKKKGNRMQNTKRITTTSIINEYKRKN